MKQAVSNNKTIPFFLFKEGHFNLQTFSKCGILTLLIFCLTAEEYQKLAFPASEFVLKGLLPPEEYEVWAPIPRIVELIFNCGRNGFTTEAITHLKSLSWRHCILVEERYGSSECVITLHSLTHLHEDISRFSSPDNFWCFQFEKAVER